ncbi:hypothetical protein BC835DRAFT_571095 [Cytidiella melzeri]|nr:hypothetical protein BC835DRAFT_571095 [Cytidiella melzeri]
MYPCHNDFWLIGTSPAQDYDYEADYDVYLFWPSSSPQVLVPANARYADVKVGEGSVVVLRRVESFLRSHALDKLTWQSQDTLSPTELHSDTDDELDELELGSSQLLNFTPTFSFDSDFVFPENNRSTDGLDANGYSKLFRMGLVSKSRGITRQLDNILKSAWRTFASSLRNLRLSQ